jgi:hypothetical protein
MEEISIWAKWWDVCRIHCMYVYICMYICMYDFHISIWANDGMCVGFTVRMCMYVCMISIWAKWWDVCRIHCMYVYVCIYACMISIFPYEKRDGMCVGFTVCMCMYVYMYVCAYVCLSACWNVLVRMHSVHVCMCGIGKMHAWAKPWYLFETYCMHVPVCIYIYIYIYTCMRTDTWYITNLHASKYPCIHVCMYLCTRTCMHIHTYFFMNLHAL